MNRKFILSVGFGMLWLAFSVWLSLPWIEETAQVLPPVYVWAVVIGIAFLPGYLMSAMFFSNLLHRRVRQYPQTCEDTTVILCAHNEEGNIAEPFRRCSVRSMPGASVFWQWTMPPPTVPNARFRLWLGWHRKTGRCGICTAGSRARPMP